ncbi:MAG TPA: L-threonylcarbamoyladenylate synthase [Acidimicrobiales bacterium]
MTDIERAVAVLRRGGLVAFPTETVYGLGADASNQQAVERIFSVKGRPAHHPLIVHLASADEMPVWSPAAPPLAHRLAEAFWPGPLTILVPAGPPVADAVTGGRPTVGLRVPAHPVALGLLRAFAGGVAAPSANRFGRVSPTCAAHVRDDLGEDVDMVLDGGECAVGVESTIIDCTCDPPQLLRAGGVTVEAITLVTGSTVAPAAGLSRAPGMLDSHYAPRCRVVLAADAQRAETIVEAERARGRRAEVLDPGPDLDAYAHSLYSWLREADARGLAVLVVVPPPDTGLGVAINERLRKAAAPRPEDAGP